MPETACLHIQARDSDPIRVVEIPGSSVRIGRASFCEVRLAEPEIADEECRLKRKGGQWQLIPSRAAGFVWIDGRSVEETCAIPFDVPFRVGEHWLTLRPHGSAPAWRDYQAPAPTASATLLEDIRAGRIRDRDEPADEPRPTAPRPPAAAADDQDRLSRWKERQEDRMIRTQVSQQERRWEDRWRAAGERLRARPATAVPPRAAEPRVPPPASYRSPTVGGAEFRDPTRVRPAPTPAPAAPLRPATVYASEAPSVASLLLPPAPVVPLDRFVPPALPAYEPRRPAPPAAPDREEPIPSADWLLTSWPAPLDAYPAPEAADRVAVAEPESAAEPAAERPVAALPAPAVETLPAEATTAPVDGPQPADEPAPIALDSPRHSPEPSTEPSAEAASSLEPDPVLPVVEVPSPPEVVAVSVPEPEPTSPAEALAIAVAEEPAAPEAPAATLAAGHETEAETKTPKPEPEPVATRAPRAEPRRERVAPAAPAAASEPRRGAGPAPFVTDTHHARVAYPSVPPPPRPDFSTTVHDAGVITHRSAPVPKHPARPAASQAAPAARPEGWNSTTRRGDGPARSSERRDRESSSRREPAAGEPSREWPTVRDILDAHRAQPARTATATPTPRPGARKGKSKSVAEPIPTTALEPACWSLPLWLGWLPSLVLALAAGPIGLALAWTWAVDARNAGAVSNLLAQGTAEVKPLSAKVAPPDASWWKSTAGNLMQWALYFDRRSTAEPENAEKSLELLAAAAKASPLQSQVRFALARRHAGTASRPLPETSLGLSRDVVSLSWSAHEWLKAGKKDAALKVYRAALEMASRAELPRLAAPAFDDDPQVKRYRIPGEDMIAMVVRDLADHEGWTFAEWSVALPDYAPVPLTAARLLRERGNPDADKALDAIVAKMDDPVPEGCSLPLHIAAQAEALALKQQWAPAEARYRAAIAAMADDTVRRSWWINVADLALKLNDDSGRQKALESAKGNDANDGIAHRAIEVLKYTMVSAEKPRNPR